VSDPDNPPEGYTAAQWEMTRLQLANPERNRPADRTLPARRLVEFRCRGDQKVRQHHLLAAIYQSRRGPLAVSTADVIHTAEGRAGLNRHARELVARFPNDLNWNPKRAAWNPNPRLVELDEIFSDDPVPINCRCGSWPDLTREHLRAAVGLYRQANLRGRPLVIGVSRRGLHSARDTLCYEF
jgi:hypothetical protein